MCETHLKNDQNIKLDNYIYYGHSRFKTHVKAKRCFGGVGIFISLRLFEYYLVNVIDKSVDGILGIHLENKIFHTCIIIFVCYLPPETSPWGRNAIEFLDHLQSQIYMPQDEGQLLSGTQELALNTGLLPYA